MKICLDAGHYGRYNRSPVVPEYWESNMTWKLHLLLKKHLEAYGFEVITTRSDKNVDLALSKRGKCAKGCDLFLSLHSNAVGGKVGNEDVDRVDIYAPLDGSGHDIARKLANCIVSTMGTKQGGNVKTRRSTSGGEWYGVIRGAVSVGVPGLLVEHSFHTCTRSAQWLLDDANLDKLAQAEAKVIADHFSVKPETFEPYMVRVTDNELNVRKGAGMNHDIVTVVKKGECFTIVGHECNGTTLWGKLKSGAGYISLKFTEKV